LKEPEVQSVGQSQDQRKNKSVDADRHFQPGVQPQGIRRAVGPPAEEPTPQRQTQHEGRQDRAGGEHRVAKDGAAQPHPRDLVDQSGRAGNQEQGEHQLAQEPDDGLRFCCRLHGDPFTTEPISWPSKNMPTRALYGSWLVRARHLILNAARRSKESGLRV